MQRINSAKMSPLIHLPHDLKVLIFEFLPLQNYYPLQLTCRNFYYILLTTPRLWAKHMFSYFLNHTICEDPFLTHDPFEEKFHISVDHIKYELMTNSKTILETHYKLKNKWENFFSLFLPSVHSQELVHGIFESLRSPTFPEPSLKKNIHVFTTHTFFQNFLTEVRFGLQGKSFMTDRKQTMVQNITESLRLSLSKGGLDTDKLISLRWYFFNTNSTNKRVNRNSNISNAHLAGEKRISKVKTFLRDGRLVTVADRSFENEQLRSNSKYKGFFSNQTRWENKFSSPRNTSKSTLKDERESESVFTDHDGIDGYNTSLEEFYRLIHALMKNYCVMIFTYLKTIQDNQSILMEYIRLWDQYVLTMIELNQVLAPFSDLLNEVYNRNCEGLVNFPEFSIWRVMTKLWLNDVFTPLVSFFQKAFFSILMSVRIQDTFFKFNTLQLEKSLSRLDQKPEDGSISLKRMLSNKFSDALNLEALQQRGEQSHNLIRQFYQAVSDLSYDEFTIFYLHCITPNPQTPEGIWNTAIVNNSEMIYGFWKELLLYDPNYIVSTFQKDLELVESFFGKALSCQLKEKQMLILKDLLNEVFYAAVNEYEANKYAFNDGNFMQVENDPNKFTHITFGNIVMHLKPDEDIRKKVIEDNKCKDGVSRILNKNCPKFTALLNLLIDVKQTLDHQQRELEETYNERYQRGFPLIDEQYESFFSLNRNPSSRFVKGLPEGFSGGRSLSYTGGHDGLDKIFL